MTNKLFHLIISIFLFTSLIVIIISCGESKDDISSRQKLESIVRQINTLTDDFYVNQEKEMTITSNAINIYYENYTSKLIDLRYQNSREILTHKFTSIRNNLDSILTTLFDFIEFKSKLMNKADSLVEVMEIFNDNRKNYYNQKNYGEDLSIIYKYLAGNAGRIIYRMRFEFGILIQKYNALFSFIQSLSIKQNINLRNLDFEDTLSVLKIKPDTNDVFHKIYNTSLEFDTLTDDFK